MKPSTFFGRAAAAATAIALPLIIQGAANASCSNPSCTVFNPSSATTATGFTGFSNSYSGPPTPTFDKVRIKISLTGQSLPFSFTALKLYGDGITNPPGLDFGPFSTATAAASSGNDYYTPYTTLNTTGLNSVNFANNSLDWSIAQNVATNNAVIGFTIEYADSTANSSTAGFSGAYWVPSGTPFGTPVNVTATIPAPVPGPVPFIGAAAAFGMSRRLRTRVRLAA